MTQEFARIIAEEWRVYRLFRDLGFPDPEIDSEEWEEKYLPVKEGDCCG